MLAKQDMGKTWSSWNGKRSCYSCDVLPAGRLLQRGVAQAEVARRVGVTRTTVSPWNAQLENGGMETLKSRPRGHPSGLAEASVAS